MLSCPVLLRQVRVGRDQRPLMIFSLTQVGLWAPSCAAKVTLMVFNCCRGQSRHYRLPADYLNLDSRNPLSRG
ncbi:hypothetical protein M440DRAFT_1185417 [Trichoderma longibrachiatum ATCC 18648]|uniref:Uncharacterized protein n=1 Tax=Trichoderma longibrachiatum ATCC 18648 TaxID=983965 RepID=A0A2T4C9D0_TRILO|nr:hypothetical protein M440DRAFT_1185417 [Trichoderma longibrachiatum ATCC 18648]